MSKTVKPTPVIQKVEPELEGLESMITPLDADPMDQLVNQLGQMDGRL
jgi:hypothetical protein